MGKDFSREECPKLSHEREVSQVKKGDLEGVKQKVVVGAGNGRDRSGLHVPSGGAGTLFHQQQTLT